MKLFRTLIQYKGSTLLLPAGESPRIWFQDQWHLIEEHQELDEDALCLELETVFGSLVWNDLKNGIESFFDYREHRFLLKSFENQKGSVLFAQELPAPPELEDWPEEARVWLKKGGLLKVKDAALYAAILRTVSQNREGNVVSLERRIHYPLPSYLGFIHQKELGEHFETLEEGLKEAIELHAEVLGLRELQIPENILNAWAQVMPVLTQVV